ncbi:MAG: hypothetical protein GY952_13935 [Rhodobacteraceae bacterium]|nr:hypothetical protein [Paracoccaceae bacterium]
MNALQTTGDLEFWRVALEDIEIARKFLTRRPHTFDAGDGCVQAPCAGWYRRRVASWRQLGLESPHIGVVIWKAPKSGKWCLKDGRSKTEKDPLRVSGMFERVWMNPVSKDAYEFWLEHGTWADDNRPEAIPQKLLRMDKMPPIFSKGEDE